MNKTIRQIALLGALLVGTPQALSAAITNGNFAESCSLTGWGQEGDASSFGISGASPNCTADVSADDFSWNNTLYADLDLTAAVDSSLLLSMDFGITSDLVDDEFSIGLFNEDTFDYIDIFSGLTLENEGLFHIDFNLDGIINDNFWVLEFNVTDFSIGPDDDFFVSTLSISNVSLTEISAEVPEPTSLAIFALGFAGLAARRKNANELVRKSQNK